MIQWQTFRISVSLWLEISFFFFRFSSKEGGGGGGICSLSPLKSSGWQANWQANGFLEQFTAVPFWKASSSLEAKHSLSLCTEVEMWIWKVNYSMYLRRQVGSWLGNWTNMSKHSPKSLWWFQHNKTSFDQSQVRIAHGQISNAVHIIPLTPPGNHEVLDISCLCST